MCAWLIKETPLLVFKDPPQRIQSEIPFYTKDNIKRTLINHQEDVLLSGFMKAYSKQNGHALDPTQYNYDNLEELLKSLPFIRLQEGRVSLVRDDPFISYMPSSTPGDVILGDRDNDIRMQELPIDFDMNKDFLDVFVEEIFHPDKFYVQLLSTDCKFALKKMMSEMHEFYESMDGLPYKIHSTQIFADMLCVAKFKGQWTRAIIQKVNNTQAIQVLYFDYGTVFTVGLGQIRFMAKQFSTLPVQGILCRCANVYPANDDGNWTWEAIDDFFNLCYKSPVGLIAKVKGIQVLKVKLLIIN